MSFFGRLGGLLLPLLILSAGCSAQATDEETTATESNLDESDATPPAGPLAPDPSFGTNGALTLTGPKVAISAAKRADGSIGVLGESDSLTMLTLIDAAGSAQADVVLAPDHAVSGVVLPHRDGLVVVGAAKIDDLGRYFVSRVGADGAIDPSFTPDPLDLQPSAGAAAVTKDGKLVIAGRFQDHAAIVRLEANGALDASFGDQGLWLASDDRAVVTRLALGADDSIYAVTQGADKTLLAHLSAAGKPDARFGADGVATLPNDAGPSALAVTKGGIEFISASGAVSVDAHGAVTASEALVGQVIGFGASTGFVTAVTEGDACTVHVTEEATAALTADECRRDVSYVALGGQKRALVTNTAEGVSVRVFGAK